MHSDLHSAHAGTATPEDSVPWPLQMCKQQGQQDGIVEVHLLLSQASGYLGSPLCLLLGEFLVIVFPAGQLLQGPWAPTVAGRASLVGCSGGHIAEKTARCPVPVLLAAGCDGHF